ncbi:hypothetical protein [Halodesulfurarchaeum sp.]|uniref:hypothetical protein n=1 Tax=Halodesulfurarchaeum sp. TaxID=1980530 RepID=UPI002FC33934
MSNRNGRDVFFSTVRRESHARDVLAIAMVPTGLTAIFLLPTPLKHSLTFSYIEPTGVTAVTAHFVHLNGSHLAANLLGFVLLATTGYILAVLGGRRRLFAVLLTTYLLVFPATLSILNLAVPRPAITYGFSGVNMALAGLLPLVLTEYSGRRLHGAISAQLAPGLFFLVMTLVSLVAIPTQPTTLAVAAGSGLITLFYARQFWHSLRTHNEYDHFWSRQPDQLDAWLEFGVLGAVVAIGYPLIGYPADPAAANQIVNIYVHTLGYALAFIGSYVGLEAGILD